LLSEDRPLGPDRRQNKPVAYLAALIAPEVLLVDGPHNLGVNVVQLDKLLYAVPLFEVLGEVRNRDTARRIGRRRSDSKRTASTGKLQVPIMRACVDRVLLIHLPRHRVISGMIYSHSSSRQ
jgi:hypothetical protein